MIQLGILGSTRGSLLAPIAKAIETKQLQARIQVVLSNKNEAGIISQAKDLGFYATVVEPQSLERTVYDQTVSILLEECEVDLIVLMGYMRILSAPFVKKWENKIINVHPSLLPAFAGKMDLAVHEAVLAANVKETGCTVHYVTETVDGGPIILQKKCVVKVDDTRESLKARVQALEAEALIDAISQFSYQRR